MIIGKLPGSSGGLKDIENSSKLIYEFLEPQTYTAKIIFDGNNNKIWDTGDYIKKRQPEEVIYFDKHITPKANWDTEVDWKVEK